MLLADSGCLCPQSPSPDDLFHEAQAALTRGDQAQAIAKFQELLGLHPQAAEAVENQAQGASSASLYLIAGQARFAMNQVDLARRDADAVARIDPKVAGLATLKGMILEQTADYDGAEANLLQAIAANANDYNAHFYLGAIYYFKREMAKARVHLLRALQIQPNAVQARYELALVERGDGRPQAALVDLEAVVHAMPDWLQPHVELSALYYRLHRPQDGAREKQLVDRMMEALQKQQSENAR